MQISVLAATRKMFEAALNLRRSHNLINKSYYKCNTKNILHIQYTSLSGRLCSQKRHYL